MNTPASKPDFTKITFNQLTAVGMVALIVIVIYTVMCGKDPVKATELSLVYTGSPDRFTPDQIQSLNTSMTTVVNKLFQSCDRLKWSITYGDVSRTVKWDVLDTYKEDYGCLSYECEQYGWQRVFEFTFDVSAKESSYIPARLVGQRDKLHFGIGSGINDGGVKGITYKSNKEGWMCTGSDQSISSAVFIPW